MEGEFQYAWWISPLLLAVLVGGVAVWNIAIQRIYRGRPLLRRRRRRPVPWGADGAVLALFSLANAAMALLLVDAQDDGPFRITFLKAAYYTAFTGTLAIGIASWLVARVSASPADFGWPRPSAGSKPNLPKEFARDLGVGVAAWLAILPMVYLVQVVIVGVLDQPSSHPAIEQLISEPSGEALAASALLAVVVAPLFEEFAFRVLLQGWLERVAGSRRAWWPIVVSSAAFAASHTGQGFAPVPLFVLSLGFGYVYRQTHRFAACSAMHAAFNGFSLLVASGIQSAN